MSRTEDQISTMQTVIVYVNYVLAVGVLTLPRTISEAAKTPDGWISILIGGAASLAAGLIITRLGRKFPGQTIYQYAAVLLGRPLGYILGTVIALFFIGIAAFELRTLQEVVQFFLLEGTPVWAINFSFLWIALYLCLGGMSGIARLCQFIVVFTWSIFLLVCLLTLEVFDLNNLRPVLGEGLLPVLKAVKPTALTFTAGEIMLFLTPFMLRPRNASKAVAFGVGISGIFYLVAYFVTVGAFSVNGVLTRTWPFLDAIRSFEVEYLLFERFESLLLAIWCMQIFCTFCISFYAAAYGAAQMSGTRPQRWLYGLLPLVFLTASLPRSLNHVFGLGDVLGNTMIYLFGLLPVILLLVARIRKVKTS